MEDIIYSLFPPQLEKFHYNDNVEAMVKKNLHVYFHVHTRLKMLQRVYKGIKNSKFRSQKRLPHATSFLLENVKFDVFLLIWIVFYQIIFHFLLLLKYIFSIHHCC